MATEITADTPLTFEMVRAADGKTMALWMKTRRAELDAVLQKESEALAARVGDQNARLSEQDEARRQRAEEIQREQEQAQADRAAEAERVRKLTPEERIAEARARAAESEEQERQAREAQIAEETDKAYLSTLPKGEKEAEIKRREEAAAAAQQAIDDAAAAEAQKIADEAAAAEAQKVAEEKAAADKIVADKAAADKAVADAAEAEKKALEEKQRIALETPKQKIVVDYQATDEDGNPIGRPTHLEADNWEEMSKKQVEAHVNAVRYAERLKKKTALKPIAARTETPIRVLTDEERVAIEKEAEAGETTKAELAKLKLEQDDTNRERLATRNKTEYDRQVAESNIFVKAHTRDFFPCQANANALSDYLAGNNPDKVKLEWNVNNLEIAFEALRLKLANRPEEAAAVPPNPEPKVEPVIEVIKEIKQDSPAPNPPAAPAPTPVVAPVETPVVPPAAPTPVETPKPVDNPPAPVRQTPASGIEPGSLHGNRTRVPSAPVEKTASQIKQEIARMPLPEYKKKLKDPNFRKLLNSVGIKA